MIDVKSEFIVWRKEMETGVPFVDSDHRVLVNLLNQASSCLNQSEELTVLGSVLDALIEYTGYHFFREERMMAHCGYAALEDHQEAHGILKRKVQNIRDTFQNDPASVSPDVIHNFLQFWLVDHVMGHDFAYREICGSNLDAVSRASQEPFFNERTRTVAFDWDHVRVMLVDDNPNIRKLVQTVLKAAGIRNVQLMKTPQDGIARLAQRSVDVILCDWVMDGMNGTEFAHVVGNMELPTRIIMMTGYSSDILRERASDLNIFGFLEKPVKARELLEMISRAAQVGVA